MQYKNETDVDISTSLMVEYMRSAHIIPTVLEFTMEVSKLELSVDF